MLHTFSMLKNWLILLLIAISGAVTAQAPVVFVNAGSRAPYGKQQELMIYPNGLCKYYSGEVNGMLKDSATFNITAAQLQSFFTKATSVGFFELEKSYNGKKTDGAGVYISLNYNGRKKKVYVANTPVPPVDELMKHLNSILAARAVYLSYGQPK